MEIRLCKHYKERYPGGETIAESNGYPWNAWILDKEGRELAFQAGLFWEYLEHLLENRECRREIGVDDKKTYIRILDKIVDINEMWKETMYY